ncbi:MAG: hypothetical protein ACE37D_01455 [Pseudomonadales bacterium]
MSSQLKTLLQLLPVWLLITACQNPFLVFPGKSLSGEVAYTSSFQFAAQFPLLQLETSGYSVILRTTVIDGELYVDAAPARRWGKYLAETRRARLKLGDKLYPARAEVVSDEAITSRFLTGRTVYRMVPLSRLEANESVQIEANQAPRQ